MSRSILASIMLLLTNSAFADTIFVNGVERQYILDAPAGAIKAPLIVALHGGSGSSKQLKDSIDLTTPANAKGIVVVYPNGLKKMWNDGRITLKGQLLTESDDVGFLTALIAELVTKNIVDPNRITFAGISNGAMMSFKMACDSTIPSYGVVAISANIPVPLDCNKTKTRILNIVGTADRFVSMAGGYVLGFPRRGSFVSSKETFNNFLVTNGCKGTTATALPDASQDGMTSTITTGNECVKTPTAQIVVQGGGHAWAGSPGPGLLNLITGKPTMDFSATHMLINFASGEDLLK